MVLNLKINRIFLTVIIFTDFLLTFASEKQNKQKL